MVNKVLVTTALEDSWPKDPETPVLFLGEWCRLYSRKERWQKMNSEVLSYHWDDRTKLYNDYIYINHLYEKCLNCLSEKLNEIHKVDHSVRYWRILIGPWLGQFIQMLFDRWSSLYTVFKEKIDYTIVLSMPESNLIPNDMRHFNDLYIDDKWNHFIYHKILDFSNNHDIKIRINDSNCDSEFNNNIKISREKSWKVRVIKKILDSLNKFYSSKYFFINTYLNITDQWKLDLMLGQIPQYRDYLKIISPPINFEKRKWKLKIESIGNEFDLFLENIIPKQIPSLYLEGYIKLTEEIKKNNWPDNPKLIWTSNSYNSDDHFKAYCAKKVENNVKLVIGQHGGHYGIGLWSFSEDHELKIADRYLSWGWTDDKAEKVRPIGQFKLKNKIKYVVNNKIVLVTSTMPRYSYEMLSATVSRQWLDYLEDQFEFCEKIGNELRKNLIVRLYQHDYGWNQKERWKDKFPNIELDSGASSIEEIMKESKIYVSTYNATTYLEAFAINIPTIIFWNPKHWEIRESAKNIFSELERVKIFHSNPESAAKHIQNIWSDVDEWWKHDDVQRILMRFNQKYNRSSSALLELIKNEIEELV